MNSAELGARLVAVLGEGTACTTAYGVVTADVERERWREAVAAVRDDPELDGRFFDLLTAVDAMEEGFEVVVRLWSLQHRHAVHVRTRCPRADARVPSVTGLFAGAAWHERATAELFGIGFDGHPALEPLLLPPGTQAHPLRKEEVLPARLSTPWPGAVEPERTGSGGGRVRLPYGVPAAGRRPGEAR